jgi:hypothetical protein
MNNPLWIRVIDCSIETIKAISVIALLYILPWPLWLIHFLLIYGDWNSLKCSI